MQDIKKIYEEKLGDSFKEYRMPAPSFSIMQAEIIAYDEADASLTIKMPVLETFLNPFGTMQGGMIVAAMDNAIGSLSMLVAPLNMTRNIDSKLIKAIPMDVETLYITATLFEQKKRRLIFEVVVKDEAGEIYATAKITNWMVADARDL
jgi:uncharacterized protein (TIGR00369 family)